MDVATPASESAGSSPGSQVDSQVAIIGLGTHAYTPWLLDRIKLRTQELPFDGLISDPGMLADIVDDDFTALLDHEAIVPVPDARGRAQFGHRLYSGTYRRPVIFNTSDPTTDSGRRALQESIERFRTVLAGTGRKIFVCITGVDRCGTRSVRRLAAALAKRTSDGHLVTIRLFGNDPSLSAPLCETIFHEPGVTVYDFTPRTTMQAGLSFADRQDNDRIADLIRWHVATTQAPPTADAGASPADRAAWIEEAFARVDEHVAGVRGAVADQQVVLRTIAEQDRGGMENVLARLEQQVAEGRGRVAEQLGPVRSSLEQLRADRVREEDGRARIENGVSTMTNGLAVIGQELRAQQQRFVALQDELRLNSDAARDVLARLSAQNGRLRTNLAVTIVVGLALAALIVFLRR